MRLFSKRGFDLGDDEPDFTDQYLSSGRAAEVDVLEFLRARGIRAKSADSVLREMRAMREAGALNERIMAFRVLLQTHAINDQSPVSFHDILVPNRS